ncbi:MAG: hypothetical protein QOK17_387 [Sphingomonadales bacterium]|nr:hypothetical protein [Sphingomonadales bacterium]
MKAFFDSKPYELFPEQDPNTGEHVYRVRVHKCVPDEFSIIVGDVVHNLRSALDQLVCGLVRANRKQVTGGNGFPIMGSRKSFEDAAVGKLKNVGAKADRFIRRLKPYKGGNASFWLLSELDNMDKHNAIVPVAAGQAQAAVQWGLPFLFWGEGGKGFLGQNPGPGYTPFRPGSMFGIPEGAPLVEIIYDNCEVYRSKVGPLGIAENIQVTLEITFGKTQVTQSEPIAGVLHRLVKLVERTIDIVERRIL